MPTLRESLTYEPVELKFGTSGLRDLAANMTDLECYLNTAGFLQFLVKQQQFQQGETVLVAGDLRDSTPRILASVIQSIHDAGFQAEYHGLVPTPTIAYYALERGLPCIMVTGSHIPADRNGIKFYKKGGEVLKPDEAPIKEAVAAVRGKVYGEDAETSAFQADGMLKQPPELPAIDDRAEQAFRHRYLDVFPSDCLAGKKIVYYQHSAVGRDLLVDMFKKLGADVVTVGRSDVFVPIDSENVTPDNKKYFKQLAAENPDAFAIVSTDGDSDRPFVIDETGEFHRGDMLGVVTAAWCKADFADYPVSASDASDAELKRLGIEYVHTKIGSPYVIVAMQEAEARGKKRVVCWEVNGGFMLGTPLELEGGTLKALPTRDAFFPIFIALLSATQEGIKVSELFGRLPQRFTDAGLIDDFPVEVSKAMIERFSENTAEVRKELDQYFPPEDGFDDIKEIDTLDGVRIKFTNGDIAHLRPSSNAPQLRIYSVADSPERAAEIVALAIAEPDGIFRRMQKSLS
jgi:phosphomannomutase